MQDMAKDCGMLKYYEVSAKTGDGVKKRCLKLYQSTREWGTKSHHRLFLQQPREMKDLTVTYANYSNP
jgi:hypothetical protein